MNLFKVPSSGNIDISRLNYSHTVLVPKKSERPTVRDYKPISLELEILKIISKTLSIRLSKIMEALIGPSQSTFIKGCLIFESFVFVSETINLITMSKTPGILLKFNFEKAFDSLEWNS